MQIGCGVATRIALLLGLVVGIGARSQAAPILVEVRIDTVLVQSWNSAALSCAQGALPPGMEACSIANQDLGDFTIRNLNLQLGPRAIPIANIAVNNDTAATHQLTVDIILSVPSTGGLPIETSGSLSGSVTDGITTPNPVPGNGSATLSTLVGSALYAVLLDNVPYDTLSDSPYSLTTATSASIPTPNRFGFPNPPSQPGPPIGSTITLRYDFTLTGEDQAGLQGNFNTEIVPEPSTAMLLALGLTALVTAGRRR